MNNNYVKVVVCFLIIQSVYASENSIYEQRLSESERTCDPRAYATLIASQDIEQWRKNYSLANIVQNCATSRNLNELVSANVSSGGQVKDTAYFDSHQWMLGFGYDRTALGFLARLKLDAQKEDITKDLEGTTKTLVENGGLVDTALLDSYAHQNVPVSQALLKLGADPHKLVCAGLEVVSAFKIAESNVSRYKDYQKESYLCAWKHFFLRTKYPDGSSYAKAQWDYARDCGRKAKSAASFIRLLSKQS